MQLRAIGLPSDIGTFSVKLDHAVVADRVCQFNPPLQQYGAAGPGSGHIQDYVIVPTFSSFCTGSWTASLIDPTGKAIATQAFTVG